MALNDGDKTEAPTPRRRTEAREKGQVARSTDLNSALLLLGAMLALRGLGPRLMQSLLGVMRESLTVADPEMTSHIDVIPTVSSAAFATLSAAGPIMLGLLLLALASNLLQVGFLMTGHPIQPSLNKINPLTGFSRLFSTRTLVQLAMNLLKLALVCFVAYVSIRQQWSAIFLALETDGGEQAILVSQIVYGVGVRLALVLLVLALLDFGYQRLRHEKDLKMSKEEVKEEMRRMEGDPMIKQRRRRMQFAAAMQRIRKNVPTADVVVTNPTELAIAIKYDAESMRAPTVVAKGRDFLAQKIREIAIQHGVPIIEKKPLAQALYKTVEVGQEVPEQFYKAIAEILAYVYELSGRARRMRAMPAA
ncbi:MAG TPA: flagellar biosynthesis protein FlhB [Phycisphaerae bacterium]|nr:flagellar biosynthesis protein FlhB [Phycisphaerae bacterium]